MEMALSWLAVRTFFKKVAAWCKKNWQLLVGAAIPIILTVVFRKRGDLSKVLDRVHTDYQKEIDIIEDQHATEIAKRERAQDLYTETIKKIEEEYLAASQELDSKKKKEIKNAVEKYQNDPEGLADKIAELMNMNRV